MRIDVTNCKDCIFRESDFNPDSMGHDTIDSCILLQKLTNNFETIAVYDSYLEEEIPQLNTTLPNCPLKEQEVLVKLNT